jgi:Zn-finger protein
MKTIISYFLVFTVSSLFASEYNIKQNELYVNECGSCHMAYQAQFLPKRSWNKMMDELNNHFDTDATLALEDEQLIRKYLNQNASDNSYLSGEIKKFARSVSLYAIPLKISELPKFKKEHDEINPKWVKQKEVKSFANCNACHLDAKKGLYKERNILIPNFGRWDD